MHLYMLGKVMQIWGLRQVLDKVPLFREAGFLFIPAVTELITNFILMFYEEDFWETVLDNDSHFAQI